ncbi:MAG: branched-chain amino acid aminotransferase [Christensenellales bacterium]|jgi:branched-chain amino acid aminotransferase
MQELKIIKRDVLKEKPQDESKLGFGQHFTDYMFVMRYDKDKGWHTPTIEPYAPIALDPACMTLHYGQAIFEGMKAYVGANGRIRMFRPEENMRRLNVSARRMSIPEVDEAFLLDSIKKLVLMESDWIPKSPGTSLYVRPFIFATEANVGVRASYSYLLMVILSPVGAYYASGLAPVKIYVEDQFVRAVRGGTGFTKAAANYAMSLFAGEEAKAQGYSQVLWLDGVERRYVEEVGAMNIFFRFNDELVTPSLEGGSILSGITRKSVIELARHMGVTVNERRLSIDEVHERHQKGELLEVFGSGTAAVISPVGELKKGEHVMVINDGKIGELSQKLYDTLTGIQLGSVEDPFGWGVDLD